MSIELSETSDPDELIVELNGDLHTDDIQSVIDQLGPAAKIHSFQIGIAADDPAAFSILSPEAETDIGMKEGTDEANESLSDQSESTDGDSSENNGPDQSVESLPQLQTDGDPFQLLQTIGSLDSWVRTKEIRDAIPEDSEVNNETIGANLWNLADRGLLEKRPYEDDKRQNEYRMTEMGKEALNQSLEN